MIGFGIGGILMGKLADRFGVVVPVIIGAFGLGGGFVLAGSAPNLLVFSLAHGILIGLLGCAATFAPLVADTSLWFNRRRGIAVAICASGNYLAGAIWPPVLQYSFDTAGWRATYSVSASSAPPRSFCSPWRCGAGRPRWRPRTRSDEISAKGRWAFRPMP